jgi:hypothetical protein
MPVSPIVKGYRLVATVNAVLLLLTFGNALLFLYAAGPDYLVTHGARIALVGALCYLVSRGFTLARFGLAGLSALSGLVALAAAAQDAQRPESGAPVLLGIAGLYLACAAVLAFSPSVRAYQADRRGGPT